MIVIVVMIIVVMIIVKGTRWCSWTIERERERERNIEPFLVNTLTYAFVFPETIFVYFKHVPCLLQLLSTFTIERELLGTNILNRFSSTN